MLAGSLNVLSPMTNIFACPAAQKTVGKMMMMMMMLACGKLLD
jgi:hypothetical protein